jgi:hypothetical protein
LLTVNANIGNLSGEFELDLTLLIPIALVIAEIGRPRPVVDPSVGMATISSAWRDAEAV